MCPLRMRGWWVRLSRRDQSGLFWGSKPHAPNVSIAFTSCTNSALKGRPIGYNYNWTGIAQSPPEMENSGHIRSCATDFSALRKVIHPQCQYLPYLLLKVKLKERGVLGSVARHQASKAGLGWLGKEITIPIITEVHHNKPHECCYFLLLVES